MSTTTTADTATTMPALLLDRARLTPTQTALRHHALGIWESRSWADLRDQVVVAGNALRVLDVRVGDVVAVVATNRPEWIIADLAIQGLGARTFAVHPDFSPATTSRLVGENNAVVAFVSDEEQYDKLEPFRADLPALRTIVVFNTRGIRVVDRYSIAGNPSLGWSAFTKLGEGPDQWSPNALALQPTTPITIEVVVHQLKDDGLPVVTTHIRSSKELLGASASLGALLDAHGGDELLPIASFAEPIERSISEVLALRLGATINIGEGGGLQAQELAAVQPTIAHVPVEALKNIYSDVVAQKPKRGIRAMGLNRILNGGGTRSRSAHRDMRVTRACLTALMVASIAVHRLLVSMSGWIRLGIIGALWVVVIGALILGGQAIRPFVRRTYGLANARSILTGPGLDATTADFFGALQLRPIEEHPDEEHPDEEHPDDLKAADDHSHNVGGQL